MHNPEKVETEVISATKQREWTWPAAANFILGGAGAGFYLLSFLNMVFERDLSLTAQPVLFGMLALLIMGLGFVFLITEAGRPFRGRYLLCHLQTAWISRETLAITFFAPAVLLDQFLPHPFFKTWAALAALAFMITQGFIVYSSRAVPTWNVSIMPLFFISSGLTSGSGMALLLAAHGMLPIGGALVLISLLCVIFNLIIWFLYLRCSSAFDFRSATQALNRPFMTFIIIVLGHAFPILILLLFQILSFLGMEEALPGTIVMASGIAVIIGVAAQKAGIILSAGITRKVVLKFQDS